MIYARANEEAQRDSQLKKGGQGTASTALAWDCKCLRASYLPRSKGVFLYDGGISASY